jgi:hypothetical protein
MRQKISSEQRHERDGKRLEALVENFERCFSAQGIAHEYRDKVDHIINAKAPTGKAHSLCYGFEETTFGQISCHQRDLPKPGRC